LIFLEKTFYLKQIRQSPQSCYKNILAGSLATMFEWYDYAVYGYFAVIIGKNFFPHADKIMEILSAFAVFATGFIMRPIGSILFGYIGDRLGRRKALSLSVFMMAISTCLLGIIPTHRQIGILAPILLVIIRLFQGLAVGGNYGGSFVFAIEHAQPNKKGLAGSLVAVGVIVGFLSGSAMAVIFSNTLSPNDLQEWGWRIPFLLGLIAIFAGVYIQRHTEETPYFQIMKTTMRQRTKLPITVIFKEQKQKIAQAVGFILFDVVGIYVLFSFMTTYLTTYTKIPVQTALQMNTINLLCMVLCIPVFGIAADKFGYKKIMYFAAASFLIFSYPAFVIFSQGNVVQCWLMQLFFAIVIAAVYGVLPVAIVELFPVDVRYSASSFVCNVSAAIFGGTAPWFSTWLIYKTELLTAPAFYLMLVSVFGFIAIRAMQFVDKK
jgi:MHS family proline/betaine transporter-like MFS transporter